MSSKNQSKIEHVLLVRMRAGNDIKNAISPGTFNGQPVTRLNTPSGEGQPDQFRPSNRWGGPDHSRQQPTGQNESVTAMHRTSTDHAIAATAGRYEPTDVPRVYWHIMDSFATDLPAAEAVRQVEAESLADMLKGNISLFHTQTGSTPFFTVERLLFVDPRPEDTDEKIHVRAADWIKNYLAEKYHDDQDIIHSHVWMMVPIRSKIKDTI